MTGFISDKVSGKVGKMKKRQNVRPFLLLTCAKDGFPRRQFRGVVVLVAARFHSRGDGFVPRDLVISRAGFSRPRGGASRRFPPGAGLRIHPSKFVQVGLFRVVNEVLQESRSLDVRTIRVYLHARG